MTSAVSTARPALRELTSASAAALQIAGSTMADGPVGRVGLELEAHCFDLAEPRQRPGWQRIQAVIAQLAPLPGGSRVTVEPGGAVELSGPPAHGPVAAVSAAARAKAAPATRAETLDRSAAFRVRCVMSKRSPRLVRTVTCFP